MLTRKKSYGIISIKRKQGSVFADFLAFALYFRRGGEAMAKVPTNISIDADIKAQAQTLLADMGMDLSTAVNIFLRQMVRDHAIPFAIRTDPIHPMEKAGGRTGSEEVRNL